MLIDKGNAVCQTSQTSQTKHFLPSPNEVPQDTRQTSGEVVCIWMELVVAVQQRRARPLPRPGLSVGKTGSSQSPMGVLGYPVLHPVGEGALCGTHARIRVSRDDVRQAGTTGTSGSL